MVGTRVLLILALGLAGCGDGPTAETSTFTVGGTVSGLHGVGCVLRNSGSDDLAVSAEGPFTFRAQLPTGAPYSATVFRQPTGPTQTCTITNGSGTVSDSNVTNIGVSCSVNSPACSPAPLLGSISGDLEQHNVSTRDSGQAWIRVLLTENSSENRYLSAHVILEVPPGVDYDLAVYCFSCGGALAGVSRALAGIPDTVKVRWDDHFDGTDQSAAILIHVEYFSGQSANPWTLRVRGNQPVAAATCTL
jgi:hypothetical protein